MARACESLIDLVTKNFSMGVDGTYSLLREIIIAASGLKRTVSICGLQASLMTVMSTLKLCDFGHVLTTYVIGQHRQFGSSAYYEQSESRIFGIAGAESEQGAIKVVVFIS